MGKMFDPDPIGWNSVETHGSEKTVRKTGEVAESPVPWISKRIWRVASWRKVLEKTYSLPETNIAPENRPLEKEIPIGNHHLWRLC